MLNNRILNIFDFAFGVIETATEFDYVQARDRAIRAVAMAAAIIIGTATYVSTAAQLFWEEHGESIKVFCVRAVILTADFAGDCYFAGRDFRRFASTESERILDRAYYSLIA